ncbi:MAG: phage tail assembly chaperone [Alphaproteobacteria bacterium]|nr:phage tail assembly chaperone [Alphaproteobacteria bacterium]
MSAKRLAFPWQEAMSFGFGYMKLSSKDFWALTPKELHAAMSFLAPSPLTYPDQQSLQRLMTLYPDHNESYHE